MYQGFSAGPALPAVAIWFLSIKSCFNGTGVHLDLLYKPICKSVFKKNISALPVWLTQVNLKFNQEEMCLYRISSFWDLLKYCFRSIKFTFPWTDDFSTITEGY